MQLRPICSKEIEKLTIIASEQIFQQNTGGEFAVPKGISLQLQDQIAIP